jgi:hypothetical protein
MMKENSPGLKNPAYSWILLGIPVIFIVGSLMHFVYEWSGNSVIAGIFTPVNESVWEHLKMSFWPMLIWWIIGYFILSKKDLISISNWFVSCATALLVSPVIIVSFYYTYTEAFGIDSLILSIFSLLLGIAAAQALALHIYKYANPGPYCLNITIAVIIVSAFVLSFLLFTLRTFHCLWTQEMGRMEFPAD